MGVYEQQGTSEGSKATEPVMGHPVFPPPVAFTQPLPTQMHQQGPDGGVDHHHHHHDEWATSLCGCCSDCDVCCQTCWCPCVTFGQVAEIVDEDQGSCAVHATVYGLLCWVGIPCLYSFTWRGKLRRKFKLEKGCCGDFCVHCCCGLCAICQEHRELKSRGFDPSLGWEAAQQAYFHPAMAAPSPAMAMSR